MEQLSSTAKVICGLLRLGKRTGYEMKQLVDVSTRFFWTASYGQLYPELRRLEQLGLVTGEEASSNGRRRRLYELTRRGDEALDAWLRSDDDLLYEHRDEGLLKLFFSDGLDADQRLAIARRMRGRHEQVIGRLKTIEESARAGGGGPYMALRYGLAFHGFCAGWIQELERELEAEAARS